MRKDELKEKFEVNTNIPKIWGCKGFDVGIELEAACRVTLGHVKTGEI